MYKLLIVENEELERKALNMIITTNLKEFIQIIGQTGSGIDAVAMYKKLKPDFVLMDRNIYGIDGVEASKRMKEFNDRGVIMILSACDELDFTHQSCMDEYLLKPVRPSKIVSSILKRIHDYSINPMELYHTTHALKTFIKKVDYKNSKYILKRTIRKTFSVYSKNSETITRNLEKIIDELVDVMLELRIDSSNHIEKYREKYKDQMHLLDDAYKVENYLIDILDFTFSKLQNHKGNAYGNDINRILDYIEKNCKKNITLKEVATFGSMSPYYLSKWFKKKVGTNFSTYIMNKKVEMAKELLEHTDMPIINIALELSYNEPNYFSKVFKKVMGTTPKEYRRIHHLQRSIFRKNTLVANGKWNI